MKKERIDKYIQAFDELNVLSQTEGQAERVDLAETLLVMAYKMGKEDVEDSLDYFLDTEQIEKLTGEKPKLDVGKLKDIVYEKVEGKTFADRISDGLSQEEYGKILETEFHRVYNESAHNAAKAVEQATGRSITKTWVTVGDNRVRATHEPLEGLTKALDEKFYTIDGDETLYPGGFNNASNNCNCRCIIEFK